jgi:hypothetical protein
MPFTTNHKTAKETLATNPTKTANRLTHFDHPWGLIQRLNLIGSSIPETQNWLLDAFQNWSWLDLPTASLQSSSHLEMGSEDLSSTSTGYWMCLAPCNLGIRRPPNPNQGTKTQTIASNWPKLLGISSAMMDAAKDYARGRRHWFIHLYSFTMLLPPTPGHQDEPPRRCCDVGRVPPHIGWCSFPWIAALYSYWSIAKQKKQKHPIAIWDLKKEKQCAIKIYCSPMDLYGFISSKKKLQSILYILIMYYSGY